MLRRSERKRPIVSIRAPPNLEVRMMFAFGMMLEWLHGKVCIPLSHPRGLIATVKTNVGQIAVN